MSDVPAVTVVGALEDVPPIRYARNGDVHLAYQRFGDGPTDLVAIPPLAQNIEVAWEHPRFRRLFSGLASFCRYLHFDKRGTGMSDRDVGVPSLDERVDDLRAVLDHAGLHQAHICGVSEGGPLAVLFAAAHPDRVQSLVLYGTSAGGALGAPPSAHDDAVIQDWLARWGTEETLTPAGFTPSLAGDDAYVRWCARYERQCASPGDLRRLLALAEQIDVTHALPLVQTPTLVLHREGDQICSLEQAQHLARGISGAELVVLPGEDHSPHAGDVDALLEAICEFVGAERRPPLAGPRRALATVVFTDIVDSTTLAAQQGDARWSATLDLHDSMAASLAAAHDGRVVKSTGDGVLAVFDGPARAVRFAMGLREAIRPLGLEQRAGLHAGEVERRREDVAGMAVHIAARVQAEAGPGEVLVTSSVVQLLTGSDLTFEARGSRELRGIGEPMEVLAAT